MADNRDWGISAVEPANDRNDSKISWAAPPPSDSKDVSITIDEAPADDSKDVKETITEIPLSSSSPNSSVKKSSRSSLKKRLSNLSSESLKGAPSRIEAFIQEWTPFMLVGCYFVFSTAIYTVCTPGVISIFWFVYLATNFYIAGATVIEAFMSITPCREARKALCKLEEKDWVFPTPDDQLAILDLLIVAYLPNEQDIILDRIRYAVEKIVYPADKIRINIVYNTPKPIEPLETEMRKLAQQYSQLRIIKVPNSTSKAHNLNYFFTLDTGADVIAIFDCDHYTQPFSPRWAVERFMQDKTIDIVQGRCVVFNTAASFLAAMVSVEFDKIYAVSHPGRATTWGFGLFTGSNGYWRASLLRDLKMDQSMLTEDIDSSLRALSRNANIVHDLTVVSYELAPTKFMALWNQRLRWAQGWAQASLKHAKLTFNKSREGKRDASMRFGILSLLLIREFSYYLVTQYCCLVFSFVITRFPKSGTALGKFVYFQYPVSQWLFIISAVCMLATLVITNRVKSEFVSPWMIIVYSLVYPIYLVLMAFVGIYGHARQITKYTAWNPTARS